MDDSPRGHKWFAAFWDWMSDHDPPAMRRARRQIAGGAQGRVLEIGCGTGGNFPYYGDGVVDIAAIDPDPFMLERARKHLERAGRAIDIRQAPAEDLPFDDAAFDTVVSTVNLCTVSDPPRALAEVRRVLKPEGEFRFYEHVRYDHGFGAFWQDLITPAWRWFGAGCNPNRDIASFIRGAGFKFDRLDSVKDVPPIPPMVFVRPHIIGVARPV